MSLRTGDSISQQAETMCSELRHPAAVLELGTKRSQANRATHHADWLDGNVKHVLSDFDAGIDVDVLADCHDLEAVFDEGEFDAVLAASVWEHLERPWIAADQLAYVTKPGGFVWVATHQTFPVHGYPSDYFRFTDVALASLFRDELWVDVRAGYSGRSQIIPPAEVAATNWDPHAPCWLHVSVIAVRR